MALKASIRRLFSVNVLSLKRNNRFFSTNYEIGKQTNDLTTDWSGSAKIQRVVRLLSEYDFNETQMDLILKSIGKYIIEEKELNEVVMRDTIDSWLSGLQMPRLRPNQLDRMNAEDIDFDLTVDFNHVVSKIEPKLLLMNANAIEFRINSIKGLGITGGNRDLWRVFVYSPNGYYLQSWSDFLKKYHYLNFRVLDWLLDKKDKNQLHPHPLVRNAKVMELSFDEIRCRYLFAQRTGLKTVSIVNKLSNIEDLNKIDLKALMLTPIEKYLKLIAPKCSPEEYYALELLLSESEAQEDEKIIEDLVELSTSANVRNFKKAPKKLDEEVLKVNYQIITKNE